ncbi:hypothetical protein C0033_09090 [Clostridium sp. chh4-2]|nr:hypothetical protein C0033_09090 [Clostridium sp. chh4-2]
MMMFTFSDIMLFAALILALLTYIDRHELEKKNPTLLADRMGSSHIERLVFPNKTWKFPPLCGGYSYLYF